jgi:hypothetical protein
MNDLHNEGAMCFLGGSDKIFKYLQKIYASRDESANWTLRCWKMLCSAMGETYLYSKTKYLFNIAGSILLRNRFGRYPTSPSCRLLYC